MERSLITQQELISLLKAKQKKGFDLLYAQYAKALFHITLKVVHDSDLAQDVLQDSFVKIWTNIDAYEPSKGSLFTWILNITRNTAIDKKRSLRYINDTRTYGIDNEHTALDGCFTLQPPVEEIGIQAGLAKLKPEYQLLMNYVYKQGYTQVEIARELHIPLGTVKTRIKSAISQLKCLLL